MVEWGAGHFRPPPTNTASTMEVIMFIPSLREVVKNCDSEPCFSFCFGKIILHIRTPDEGWDANKMTPQLVRWARGRKLTGGMDLWKVSQAFSLNACVLDYLLIHPELIPSEWKGSHILFSGTVFCDLTDNFLYAAALVWSDLLQKWVAEPVFLADNDDGRGLERLASA